MKIAMLGSVRERVPPRSMGSPEMVIHTLTESLVGRGHDVTLYATGDSRTSAKLKFIYPRPIQPIAGADAQKLLNHMHVEHCHWALHDAIASGADVVHSHNWIYTALNRSARVPHVHTIHWGTRSVEFEPVPMQRFMYTKLARSFVGMTLVALSDAQRDQHRAAGARNIRTVPNPIDLRRYEVREKKDDYLLFLGRIVPEKGVLLAIRAARRARLPIKIAGPADLHPAYAERVLAACNGTSVEYLGKVSHVAKIALLQRARAVLFPVQWAEPFGLVQVESMACGTPVIGFPFGSVPEVVEDGVSGYVVATVEEMARRARDVAGLDPHVIRAYVERNYSVERIAAKYEAAYRHAMRA